MTSVKRLSPHEKARIAGRLASQLRQRLVSCDLCPRLCRIDRRQAPGYCGVAERARLYTAFLHRGEEPVISGPGGSGTVFFSGCSLRCVYCQNYKFSQLGEGQDVDERTLSRIFLKLKDKGADNINLVTPAHVLVPILEALSLAFGEGLDIPIVYNTSGYERAEIIELLGPIVDVYLTDMRYIDPAPAASYSRAPDYLLHNQESLMRMYRQKEVFSLQGELASSGVIVRHLVLPGRLHDAKKVITWLAENTPGVRASILFQYRPYFKADAHHEINRGLSEQECGEISRYLETSGLQGWVQEYDPNEKLAGVHFKPDLNEYL